MKNPKTKSDLLFESYLSQRKLPFVYEPFADRNGKNPDYLVRVNKKKVLVEVKEIENLPLDKAIKSNVSTGVAFGLNINDEYDLLRRRIDSASQQLKPYKDEVDYCVIMLGKENGFDVDLDSLFYAMFGDPYLSIPINPVSGSGNMDNASWELKALGALRKNNKTRQMYSPHNFISGIGLIKSFNAYNYYTSKIINRYTKSKKYEQMTSEQSFDYLNRILSNQTEIPKIYMDKSAIFHKVELITNPLGANQLPANFFNGRWDYQRFPKVIQRDYYG